MVMRPYEGSKPRCAKGVYIDESAQVIGQVSVGADSSLWPMVVVRGDVNTITIGARTSIQDGTIIHATHDSLYTPGGFATVVGDEVTVGHQAMLHGCLIEYQCMIGMGSIVLDGVVIESEVLLGAGSLVPPGKRLESGYLYVGSPAKQIRALTDKEKEHIRYNATHYVRLKDNYLLSVDS